MYQLTSCTPQDAERKNLSEALKMRETETIALWEHKKKKLMQHLEEKKIGFQVSAPRLQIVCQVDADSQPETTLN